jgi:ketosteroid isomerase-like protein
MTRIVMSRRHLLGAGACALTGAVSLPGLASSGALGEQNLTNEEIVRKWYAAWGNKDLATFNLLLADDFTFSSAAGDDHISKSKFKTQCWDTQIDFIGDFDLERITTGANDAFVKYLCHTKNGKAFRNVEYLRIKNGKLESIECYFGAQSSFPSAVSSGQS